MRSIGTMLNAMLDINQIEAGIIQAKIVPLIVNDMLNRLCDRFREQAAALDIELVVVPCSLVIATDPGLLEQMLSNLIGNALKYTRAGRVLVGVRRRGPDRLRIEVWDTGIGIPADQLEIIFEEYHQLNNAARDRTLGLGLGLSIVGRLGALLGHAVTVRSTPGKGSMFAVEMPRAALPGLVPREGAECAAPRAEPPRRGRLLLIEDDPDIRALLETFLGEEGFEIAVAADGRAAMALVATGTIVPELILADYNLTGGQTGLAATQELRRLLGHEVPVIIITGDISAATLRQIADAGCAQMNKPMSLHSLLRAIGGLLGTPAAPAPAPSLTAPPGPRNIYVVDDDPDIRAAMRAIFEQAGKRVETFCDAESFLAAVGSEPTGCCLVVDAALPGITGLQVLQILAERRIALPAIMVTGHGDIGTAVAAMKAGAADFLEKPVDEAELLACVRRVLDEELGHQEGQMRQRDAARQIGELTARQREVMERVLAGEPSKNIAADLGISQRTVENHRAAVMLKTGVKSIPALARLAVMATKT